MLDMFIQYFDQSRKIWNNEFNKEFNTNYISGLSIIELYLIGTQYNVIKPVYDEVRGRFEFPIYDKDVQVGRVELLKRCPVLTLYKDKAYNLIEAFGNNISGQLCDIIDGKQYLTFITNDGIKQDSVDYYYTSDEGLEKIIEIVGIHDEYINEESLKLTK